MHFRTLDHSRLILNAIDKYQALRKVSHIIYWRGSKPYGIPYTGSNHEIHLVRVTLEGMMIIPLYLKVLMGLIMLLNMV